MSRGSARTVAGVAMLGLAIVVFALEPLHGPVLLSASGNHGLDLGDLVALPFAVAGLWLLAGSSVHQAALRLLTASRARGLDVMTVGLLSAGAGFVLVGCFRELDVRSRIPHAGVVPVLVLAAGLALMGLALVRPGAARETFGVSGAVLCAALIIGFLVDSTDGPAGSVVGPTLVAVVLAFTLGRRDRLARWLMLALAAFFVVVDLAAWPDIAFLEADRELDGGGLARSVALGLVLLVVGLVRLRSERRALRAVPPAADTSPADG